MKPKLPRLFLYLLGAVFLLNLLQGAFTELLFDEAYYWHYSREMAWGYFDHPPMVALLIKIGSMFFDGELGVRFMSSLLSVGTIWILWATLEEEKKSDFVLPFFVLVFSMPLLNAYGFFTLPDTSLLFFTALFLLIYKKFIQEPSWVLSLALGVCMAALVYSKYHGVLVILFVLLSNLKLLKNKHAWVAVVISLICFSPHFLWLVRNDFISIRYHLFERPNQAYEFFEFTGGYFLNLIALFGLTFPWVYWALFKSRSSDTFTRALLYLTYGVMVFFLISSFQRRVQTQWLILICIPLAILAFRFMMREKQSMKWIMRTGIANIVVLLVLRVGLVYEPLFPVAFETHGNKRWVDAIKSQIGDMPVVFENSYREASMYAFYSENPSFSLNNIYYRKNQYSIDGSEAMVQHQRILQISKYLKSGDLSYEGPGEKRYYGIFKPDFESFRKLECKLKQKDISVSDEEVSLDVFNPYSESIALEKLRFAVAYMNTYKKVQEVKIIEATPINKSVKALRPGETTSFSFAMPAPGAGENPVYFKLCIAENELHWGLNGETLKLN
ncbi:4-amino-4-deoxy-L-arabinose transferase [Flavobacteriaceae bacterium R33]|uniref:4-amino-4-deoxy-L-arabinose transferase n=1 Tax=Poritiphilus flavus TaxID=2697053 RepID=A0A6L9EDD6_9FLAO|nr:glycosyltransferase family 39 protein [Poritiphilus flavus]NAS12707.1 4-amino-4-deoxy-L-arabinose transferase [Poritiphilus flavus]